MSNYWKHKNLDILKYGEEGVAGKASGADQAFRDWNRHVIAGDKCTYFINGKSVADIRLSEMQALDSTIQPKSEKLKFGSEEDLRKFFEKHLFEHIENDDERQDLSEKAILHFHQAGLPHATNFCIKNLSGTNTRMKIDDPATRVDFTTSKGGVFMTETNIYKKWREIIPSQVKPVEHAKSAEKYYAKTETIYQFTKDDIKQVDLTIDCPSRNLAPIFDKRPEGEQMTRAISFLREMIAGLIMMMKKKEVVNEKSEDSEHQIIFRH